VTPPVPPPRSTTSSTLTKPVLGSDAHRRIGVKLDMQRAEYEAGQEMAFSTDYPDATGPTVL
jgi:hypothetical protein